MNALGGENEEQNRTGRRRRNISGDEDRGQMPNIY
jgi:hypothetical protein